ncbi:hypothetical protein RM572_00355 [Streptomyces sp. DSM 42041]|uniref:Uncharacterized protein n=1 Tax=Streptomyces hazeniae TaxID=3075538 RepID=A0ABU2NL82_9ACTN|nr:hypothetical protein [Streptomyces sp. DSM 42041]MDT0377227.1 hypothetical protein [Streptomyces sp. DSM 42041]
MVGRQPFRLTPALPTKAYKTYRIAQAPDRLVRAACEQVGCAAWRYGWETTVDEATPLGAEQAAYIRRQSGRTFRELRTGTGLTVFRFEPGQRCFADHKTRPQRFVVRGGDWRGNPTGQRRLHQNGADWVEDFGENQQAVREAQQRG